MCLKNDVLAGTNVHCIWSCPKIQAYWVDILQNTEKYLV